MGSCYDVLAKGEIGATGYVIELAIWISIHEHFHAGCCLINCIQGANDFT